MIEKLKTKTPPKRRRLNATEAAEYIGAKPRTLKYWRQMRMLPFYRIANTIVFDVADLDIFLRRHRVDALTGGAP